MKISDYRKYISAGTMMGPNSVQMLAELLERHPLDLAPDDTLLDLGCGTGLTSLVLARETGARVVADDLWVSAEENRDRFAAWGVGDRITPVRADANSLPFGPGQFRAMVSVDAYHYFAGVPGFFQEKLLPFLREDGEVLIGIPGLKDSYRGRARELLGDWLGEDAHLFKTPSAWAELMGSGGRISRVETWEMDCFDRAWGDWLSADHPFAQGDLRYYERIIRPYTCFVGIYVRLGPEQE